MDYPQKGEPRPRMPPCVIALSAMGLKLRIFEFLPREFLPTKQKQTQSKRVHNLCALCSVKCLSSRSDHSSCRWQMQLANHGYFDYEKNPMTPYLSPMLCLKWCRFWARFWDLPCTSVGFNKKKYCTAALNHPVKENKSKLLYKHKSAPIVCVFICADYYNTEHTW